MSRVRARTPMRSGRPAGTSAGIDAVLGGDLGAALLDQGEQLRAVGGEVGPAGGHRVVAVAGRGRAAGEPLRRSVELLPDQLGPDDRAGPCRSPANRSRRAGRRSWPRPRTASGIERCRGRRSSAAGSAGRPAAAGRRSTAARRRTGAGWSRGCSAGIVGLGGGVVSAHGDHPIPGMRDRTRSMSLMPMNGTISPPSP